MPRSMNRDILNTPISNSDIKNLDESAISVRNVVKSYTLYNSPLSLVLDHTGLNKLLFWRKRHQAKKFLALNEVTIELRRGERLGIIGRNGAGKTTLLKLITGNYTPTSGEVRVNGTVQALMQTGLGFDLEFSGIQNIRASIIYNGLGGKNLENAIEDVVDFVELDDFLYQPIKTYSKGMLARLQFAVSTAIKPDILIIDEVLGAGDSYFAGKCAHRMQKLTSSGCTLLLVSHSMAQVLQFCDRAIWLDNGEIRSSGEALKIVKEYEKFISDLKQISLWNQAVEKESKPTPNEVKPKFDYATPKWQKEVLTKLVEPNTECTEVSRWTAEKGLKIVRVDVLDKAGKISSSIESSDSAFIDIYFIAEFEASFECRFVVLIMTLSGLPLIRHLSEPQQITLKKNQEAQIRLSYKKLYLTNGEFVFSAAIYKQYDPDKPQEAIRYDLLSRSFRLKVRGATKSEPGIFFHPAEWSLIEQETGNQ